MPYPDRQLGKNGSLLRQSRFPLRITAILLSMCKESFMLFPRSNLARVPVGNNI